MRETVDQAMNPAVRDEVTAGPPPPDPSGIDRARYVPFFINSLSNQLTYGSARLYAREFGIGVIEWRVLGFLGHDDGTSANHVARQLAIDKAAISRALRRLERKALVRSTSLNGRQKILWLTDEGRALHQRIMPRALERQRLLLGELSGEEVSLLIDLLRKVQIGAERLQD